MQRVKKVVSDSPGLVDLAIRASEVCGGIQITEEL